MPKKRKETMMSCFHHHCVGRLFITHRNPISLRQCLNSSFTKGASKKGSKKRSQSSRMWTKRHEKDPFVQKARAQGNVSRAIYKLEQLDSMAARYVTNKTKQKQKFILQRGWTVLDLGAAPGSWSQYISRNIGTDGTVIAVDLLPLDDRTVTSITRNENGPMFHVIQGDFTSRDIQKDIVDLVYSSRSHGVGDEDGVDCIVSDMAANFTGDKMTDALKTMNLCEDALMLAAGPSCFDEQCDVGDNDQGVLNRGGAFLCKYFACGKDHERDLVLATKRHFEISTTLKPRASRKESAELYLFATGYKGGRSKD